MLTQVLSRDSTDSLSMETPPNKHVYRPQITGYQHLGCIPQPGDEVAEDEETARYRLLFVTSKPDVSARVRYASVSGSL